MNSNKDDAYTFQSSKAPSSREEPALSPNRASRRRSESSRPVPPLPSKGRPGRTSWGQRANGLGPTFSCIWRMRESRLRALSRRASVDSTPATLCFWCASRRWRESTDSSSKTSCNISLRAAMSDTERNHAPKCSDLATQAPLLRSLEQLAGSSYPAPSSDAKHGPRTSARQPWCGKSITL